MQIPFCDEAVAKSTVYVASPHRLPLYSISLLFKYAVQYILDKRPAPQSTYIHVYRVQSSVWRLPNYWPPTPSPPSECVFPPHQRRGGTHSPGGEGWGVNISEDARHWIGLLQYNPSIRLATSIGKDFPACPFCPDRLNLGKKVSPPKCCRNHSMSPRQRLHGIMNFILYPFTLES